jgi:hypothetical protein
MVLPIGFTEGAQAPLRYLGSADFVPQYVPKWSRPISVESVANYPWLNT